MRSRFRASLSRVARLGQRIGWPSGVEQRYSASESVVEMCWGAAAASQAQFEMMGWLDSPIVRDEYVLPQLFSERGSDYWVREVVEHYSIPRDGAWLSLGSGTGKHEVRCRQEGLCAAVDAYDIAPEAVGIARSAAQAAGVQGTNFQVRDFEEMSFPSEHYDVLFAAMALHHMRDLEAVVQRIKGSLKLGGWLIADEYVGPSRFQFPDHQVTVINELLSLLPQRYRYDYVHDVVKSRYERRPVEFWLQADPSEAACSDQIEVTLRRHFGRLDSLPYGGSILGPLLEHIIGNFDPKREDDVAIIRLLGYIEHALIERGLLENDFAIFVAQSV